MTTSKQPSSGVLTGAAFLMAVSAIGPGFLTQTTQFTSQLGANLGFAILLSIAIDVGAQLNTWRVICVSGRRGHEVADAIVPGLSWVVAAVIVVGSFIFNLGNLSGCVLAIEALTGLPQFVGASLSALLAAVLFMARSRRLTDRRGQQHNHPRCLRHWCRMLATPPALLQEPVRGSRDELSQLLR